MQISRSTDYELIRSIITHPDVYGHLTDDFSPPADQYQPIESDRVWHLVASDGPVLLGLWVLYPHNAICWEIHTALLPAAYGERALRATRAMLAWLWAQTPCRRLITNVPTNNRLAYHFALKAGMEVYGHNERSILKGGQLLDQICMGLSRPAGMPLFAEVPQVSDTTEAVAAK